MAYRNEDSYYFPPGRSVARRVHGERAVGLLYGQRALLIGALEPLTYTGTVMSTRSADRPFQRPELMLWTLAVIADSGRAMYEAMVRPLGDAEREGLWQDYVRFGELFGLPASEVPGSYREFSAWWEERLSSPDLQATEHGLEMAPLVAFEQPVPAPARGNIVAQNHIIKGTLPARVREIFGIPWGRPHEAAFQAMTATHRRVRHLFPRTVRRGRNDVFFDAVTKTERQRGGTRTPQLRVGA